MKLKIYTIYDHAAKAYNKPFYEHTDGVALRIFTNLVNSKEETTIAQYPEQFALFCIGEYDDATGSVSTFDSGKKAIATGNEVKAATEVTPTTEIEKQISQIFQRIEALHETIGESK